MICSLDSSDCETIHTIINDAAQAYMSREELAHEMDQGVRFWGYEEDTGLVAVMGIQDVQDVTLIRHAYVRMSRQNQGIGGNLLSFLRGLTSRPLLVGTWADAVWAIRFYERHGFRLVSREEKDRLLKKYWSVPRHQVENSVVLADQKWFAN
jgi:N-acetylglutamate synthase-like GNAT family acetyltransferase